jgi:hypothetical protein
MIGSYDFCGHYEWTFDWLERVGGPALLRDYWQTAIGEDSQRHAREAIRRHGFDGMAEYWGHTLAEESPELGFTLTRHAEVFRIDMHDCPSKGFLLRNGLEQYRDYCDHCIGWIGPIMREAGFVIDHEHNHCGQCWWEIRPANASAGNNSIPEGIADTKDVRRRPDWIRPGTILDRYSAATDPDCKTRETIPPHPNADPSNATRQ